MASANHHVKWIETIVLSKHLATLEKDGYRIESHTEFADHDYGGLKGTTEELLAGNPLIELAQKQ